MRYNRYTYLKDNLMEGQREIESGTANVEFFMDKKSGEFLGLCYFDKKGIFRSFFIKPQGVIAPEASNRLEFIDKLRRQ